MTETRHWVISEDEFVPDHLHHKETVFTIGNGYLSTRGTFEESYPDESAATLIHGVFDDVPTFFTELANAPNWLELGIWLDGHRFTMENGQILSFERRLDLRNGWLSRQVRWRSSAGQAFDLHFERFASLDRPHLLCLRVSITALDAAAPLEVRAGLDGGEDTVGMVHWIWIDQHTSDSCAWLHTRTRATGIDLASAMLLRVRGGTDLQQAGWDVQNHPTLVAKVQACQGETVQFEKIVTFFTGRDVDDPLPAARKSLEQVEALSWDLLLAASEKAWGHDWEACDVEIEGDDEAQLALRFSIYQLLIAAPRLDERVNIGAKTLSGFGYRGHAFWDTEIFMLPFFIYCRPEIARNLLSYRWHNLPGARRKAAGNGYAGAQFPWESAATGDEVTPTWLIHPQDPKKLIRIWTGDIEIHVTSDIIYAILQYWHATGDDAFLIQRGAPILLETARFWASRAEWNDIAGRYEFNDVIGPDEYHEHVNNNAFTNFLIRWHLRKACELLGWLSEHATLAWQELTGQLAITGAEIENWAHVAEKIYLPYDAQTKLVEQFDGYFERKDVDLAEYEPRTKSMQTLLGIEGTNQTQVLKQPDVLMLFYLLPDLFDEPTIRINYDYYTPRTDHTLGSSLGPAIQSIMACRVGEVDDAYEHFMRAAHADLYDVRGNAGDGVHGASAGGLWQAAVFGFGGLCFTSEGWTVQPCLPGHWRRLSFKFSYRGEQHTVTLSGE